MIETPIHAIVVDIEGTTTDIAFVHRVLFPYARERLPAYVRQHSQRDEVRAVLAEAADLAGQDAPHIEAHIDAIIDTLIRWIDEDRKATPLKTLQGMIWRDGYLSGDFKGHVYADVAPALSRWRAAGIRLYVYSSGSVAAQELLFRHTNDGDLTPHFSGYFDTTTGPKREVASYRAIQQAIDHPAAHILFLSDVVAELDAARAAGLQTIQLLRSDGMGTGDHPTTADFAAIIQQLISA